MLEKHTKWLRSTEQKTVRSRVRHVCQSAQTAAAREGVPALRGPSPRAPRNRYLRCRALARSAAPPGARGSSRSETPTLRTAVGPETPAARAHTFTTRRGRGHKFGRAAAAPPRVRASAANSAPCHGVRARRAGPGRPPHTPRLPRPRRRAPPSPVSPHRRSLTRQKNTTTEHHKKNTTRRCPP